MMGKRSGIVAKALLPAGLLFLLSLPAPASDPKGPPVRAGPGETARPADSLADADPGVRASAARRLGEAGGQAAAGPLLEALGDPMDEVRDAAAAALKMLGEPLGERIHTSLAGSGTEWKARAEKARKELAKGKDPRVFSPVVKALGARNMAVREAAADTLGVLGDRRAVEPLVQAMGSADAPVRAAAAWALFLIPDGRAFDPMVAALEDRDDSVRVAAAHALGKLGDRRAVEPLAAALEDEYFKVREAAAGSLGGLGGPRAADALLGALKDGHGKVREAAAYALGEMGERRAAAPLAGLLEDEVPEVREAAVEALGRLGGRGALDPLVFSLGDDDPRIRRAAVRALDKMEEPLGKLVHAVLAGAPEARARLAKGTDPRAVIPLVRALRNPDAGVRRAAARALGDIRDPRALNGLADMAGGWNPFDRAVAVTSLMRIDANGSARRGALLRAFTTPAGLGYLLCIAWAAMLAVYANRIRKLAPRRKDRW